MKEGSDCPTGKAQYTRDGAREARDSLRAKGQLGIVAYRCIRCDCYHVGNKSKRAKRAAMERRA